MCHGHACVAVQAGRESESRTLGWIRYSKGPARLLHQHGNQGPNRRQRRNDRKGRGDPALGADAVLAGRATLYGTAAGGEDGAARAINILKDEMKRTMAYIGTQRTADISQDVLWQG